VGLEVALRILKNCGERKVGCCGGFLEGGCRDTASIKAGSTHASSGKNVLMGHRVLKGTGQADLWERMGLGFQVNIKRERENWDS